MLAFKLRSFPAQMGLLLETTGAEGVWFTTTDVVAAALLHPNSVTVAEYVPLPSVVTDPIVGFCEADVNPFGPFHA